MKAPERIYIPSCDANDNVFVAQNEKEKASDIEYIRKDLAEKQIDDTLGQLLNPLTKLLNDSEFREYVTGFINSRNAEKE